MGVAIGKKLCPMLRSDLLIAMCLPNAQTTLTAISCGTQQNRDSHFYVEFKRIYPSTDLWEFPIFVRSAFDYIVKAWISFRILCYSHSVENDLLLRLEQSGLRDPSSVYSTGGAEFIFDDIVGRVRCSDELFSRRHDADRISGMLPLQMSVKSSIAGAFHVWCKCMASKTKRSRKNQEEYWQLRAQKC